MPNLTPDRLLHRALSFVVQVPAHMRLESGLVQKIMKLKMLNQFSVIAICYEGLTLFYEILKYVHDITMDWWH